MSNRVRDLLLLGVLAFLALGARPATESRILLLQNGSPQFLGIIATTAASTPKDNTNTAAPFTIPAGTVVVLNCSIATKYAQVASGSFTDANVVSVTGVGVPTAPLITNDQVAGQTVNAIIAVDSTVAATTCIVAKMT